MLSCFLSKSLSGEDGHEKHEETRENEKREEPRRASASSFLWLFVFFVAIGIIASNRRSLSQAPELGKPLMNAESVCISVHQWFVLFGAANGCSVILRASVFQRGSTTTLLRTPVETGRRGVPTSAIPTRSAVLIRLAMTVIGFELKRRDTEATE